MSATKLKRYRLLTMYEVSCCSKPSHVLHILCNFNWEYSCNSFSQTHQIKIPLLLCRCVVEMSVEQKDHRKSGSLHKAHLVSYNKLKWFIIAHTNFTSEPVELSSLSLLVILAYLKWNWMHALAWSTNANSAFWQFNPSSNCLQH